MTIKKKKRINKPFIIAVIFSIVVESGNILYVENKLLSQVIVVSVVIFVLIVSVWMMIVQRNEKRVTI